MTFKPNLDVFNAIYGKKLKSKFRNFHFLAIFAQKQSTTLLFEEQQASPIFQILI